jgi:hypothetical protein
MYAQENEKCMVKISSNFTPLGNGDKREGSLRVGHVSNWDDPLCDKGHRFFLLLAAELI